MRALIWVLWRGGERLHQLGVAMKREAHRRAVSAHKTSPESGSHS